MVDMAPVLAPRILDGGAPNLDGAGITYVIVAIVYTLVLSAELYLLWRHRSAFCVQIRNIKVIFPAVSMLHVYLILVLLVYPQNGKFPCSAEYWVMSIFLPSGMAFFQGKSSILCCLLLLKSSSLQRQSTQGLRKSASIAKRLLGGCSQEKALVHSTRTL